ncbi:hypothetical protein J4476_03255 [Candidatus Woesearchaeota archaeon]|nr:MAG: hypothetical protein QT09_C0006G0038 [archaeon GW2011_AR18]MBS3161686.1 hypothetical protein [Candidatus Woesearchaeota archaeon]HIH25696.1 hypothetical protein [Nanoarchaeota archaeon]
MNIDELLSSDDNNLVTAVREALEFARKNSFDQEMTLRHVDFIARIYNDSMEARNCTRLTAADYAITINQIYD